MGGARRGAGRWGRSELDAFLRWVQWHQQHATDPSARQHVLVDGGWPPERWERWTGWRSGDPRWSVPVVDTTGSTEAEAGRRLADVVVAVLSQRRDGAPLGEG